MSDGTRSPARLDPSPAWTVVTEAPLTALSFAREAGLVLASDEASHLTLIDLNGQKRASTRVEGRIIAAEISDDGSLVAALAAGPKLLLFDPNLDLIDERTTLTEPTALAIDPHGRYIAVASRLNLTGLYTRYGRQAGRFETQQPLAHLRFIASLPMLVVASAYGSILGIELSPGRSPGSLQAEELWRQQPMCNIGRLASSGDGGMILSSGYTHGIQRYDAQGHNEGSYHLGGTVAHAVPDFAGRTIAVATTEGELALLNRGGNVRWKTTLSRPAVGLEFDPLGRFMIHGFATGEITRLDLEPSGRPQSSAKRALGGSAVASSRSGMGSVRSPDWTAPVAQTADQAETAVLTVLDNPPRIGVITNTNRLQVFTNTGGALGQAPEIIGVGRILRTAPGWIAAATDRMIVLYDARRNGAQRVDLSLFEVTHLIVRPDTYGLAIIQERDRIGRATPAGRWVWTRELRSPVEDLALGPEALTAVSTEDGRILVYDPAGEPFGTYTANPAESLCLVEAPDGSPPGLAWISLARRAQVVRGHRADGRPVWESPIPWEPWQLHRVGPQVIITAPDGRALAYDGTGHPRGQGRAEASQGLFFAGPNGQVRRIARQGVHLICTELNGRVLWRAVTDEPLGPLAAGPAGAAALLGRSLAWFADSGPDADSTDLPSGAEDD